MILSTKYYTEHGFLKGIYYSIKFLIKKLLISTSFILNKRKKINFSNSVQALSIYRKYPSLKLEEDKNELKCVSCSFCEKICPTNCISLELDENFQIPPTLNLGIAPKKFNVELKKCTRCNLCTEVCPVDAISLEGNYDFYSDPQRKIWNIADYAK